MTTISVPGKSPVRISDFPDPAAKLLHMGRGDVVSVKGHAGPHSILRKTGDALALVPYAGKLGQRTDNECEGASVVSVALTDVRALYQRVAPVKAQESPAAESPAPESTESAA